MDALRHHVLDSTNPDRFARGWHCIGLERKFASGEIATLEYFGKKLVAYRGNSEKVRIFDAFCPHMGADLSLGKVVEDNIECPFHAWQWGEGGECMAIPYCDRIPKKAHLNEWPTTVQNELLFVWHDHEGFGPAPEEVIPEHRCCVEADWSDWVIISDTASSNCRELIDNLADATHFETVHGSPVDSYVNVADGHMYCQMLTGGNPLIGGDTLKSVAYYYGPSYVIAEMTSVFEGELIESIMMIGSVAITQEKFIMHFGMKVRALKHLSFSQNQKMISAYIANGQETFFQDLRIWNTKKRVNNPILCANDGPLLSLREWYGQFYVDRSAVQPSMTRRVLEVTLSKEDTATWIKDEHGIEWNGQRRQIAPRQSVLEAAE